MRILVTILVLFVFAVALVSPVLANQQETVQADGTMLAALDYHVGYFHADPECPPSGGGGGTGC